jgi:hypothetical protein
MVETGRIVIVSESDSHTEFLEWTEEDCKAIQLKDYTGEDESLLQVKQALKDGAVIVRPNGGACVVLTKTQSSLACSSQKESARLALL